MQFSITNANNGLNLVYCFNNDKKALKIRNGWGHRWTTAVFCLLLLACTGCREQQADTAPPLFVALEAGKTGLHFSNTLTPTDSLDVFSYMYFYNGSGLGAADFNNDGLIDLFFAANQQENKLYLNEGNLHFKDITKDAAIPQDGGWSTGVSIVDINNDGLLDIYVCRVGKFKNLHSSNQLLVCKEIKNGIPVYEEQAEKFGLRFSGFSTQAAFFDFDRDGDVDLYLLNHAMHQDGSFSSRSKFLNTHDAASGDRLYRNDNGFFNDVTPQTGINSSAIGYGLGLAIADINMDGWPDIYVGNDFHENDYLYINQKNGTFREEAADRLMHSSKFTMGVDIDDINNDLYPEIVSTDMLAEDPYILKRSLGDDDYDIFYDKISFGYSYQYSRNNLQLNRKNGHFSETGLYAGIAATDWSWSPLLFDFDNDGLKDMFVANGIPKRLNDIDYVNFIYNRELQKQLQQTPSSSLVEKYQEIKIPNKFYRNTGNLHFEDMEKTVANNLPTYSNGAVYADLDNDGDLDVVVNNINDAALVYENKSRQLKKSKTFKISLKGPPANKQAIGSTLLLYAGGEKQLFQNNPVKGFMSSMLMPLQVSVPAGTTIDSCLLIWPDGRFQHLDLNDTLLHRHVGYREGLPAFPYDATYQTHYTAYRVQNNAFQSGLNWVHRENRFEEFNREPLLPHMLSTEGPALAVADINGDGLEDVFMGGARDQTSVVFVQQTNGRFQQQVVPAIKMDSAYEDVDAAWADIDNNGYPDLLVASGGNEFFGEDEHLRPRAYLNRGNGNFEKKTSIFDPLFLNASCIRPIDYNKDGWIDIFIGARNIPWSYGDIPTSHLLQNDGKGNFRDLTHTLLPDNGKLGLVTDAVWIDLNHDSLPDLVTTSEWGKITAYINKVNRFEKKDLTDKSGWWSCIKAADLDNDGDIDFIAGNLGLNSRLHATEKEPVQLYYNDFDDNGKKEQVLTYYLKHREIPFASKDELQKQMPPLRKKFLYAEDFAKAKVEDIFSKEKISQAEKLTANYFSSVLLINENGHFKLVPLPAEMQYSCLRDVVVVDANGDGLPDLLSGGNYYNNNISLGRYDADYGSLLVNKGQGIFAYESLNGVIMKGSVRKIAPIRIGQQQQPSYIVTRNNDSALLLHFYQPPVAEK